VEYSISIGLFIMKGNTATNEILGRNAKLCARSTHHLDGVGENEELFQGFDWSSFYRVRRELAPEKWR
jgi:hypothetical protein